jgi:hypothetical protein
VSRFFDKGSLSIIHVKQTRADREGALGSARRERCSFLKSSLITLSLSALLDRKTGTFYFSVASSARGGAYNRVSLILMFLVLGQVQA